MTAPVDPQKPASSKERRRAAPAESAETTLPAAESERANADKADAPAARPSHTHLPVWPD